MNIRAYALKRYARARKKMRARANRITYTHTRIQVKAPKIALNRLPSCYAGAIFHRKRCRRRAIKGKGGLGGRNAGQKIRAETDIFCENIVKTLDKILLNEYNKRKIIIKEQGKMKDFITKSGLTAAQFAKKYDIPYNTVRQWAEGIRKAPTWMVNLFKNEAEYKPLTYKEGYLLKTIHEEGIIIDEFESKGEMKNVKDYYKKKYNIEFFVVKKIIIEYENGEKE